MAAFSIEVAAHAGTCYGVQRALDLAIRAGESATDESPVHTYGPLIHNPLVVDELASKHVQLAESLDQVDRGALIIRAHGVVPAVVEAAEAKSLQVVDATCPYVLKVHRAVERLCADGYQVLVVGEAGHPEVDGIIGHAGPGSVVVSDASELDALELSSKVGVVVQTTQTLDKLQAVVATLLSRCRELKVVNTICKATSERQLAARELAGRVDAMVVIGGKNSGNTRRLAEICSRACGKSVHVERPDELDPQFFEGVRTVGITAGASTPQTHIDAVVERLTRMNI